MPSVKSITSAFCFCLLTTFCAVSANAETTYTYTGPQFEEFGAAGCPPTCNITGFFRLATPLPANATVGLPFDTPFAFSAGPFTFTNTVGPFAVSTNAAGVIDSWDIAAGETLDDGDIAIISTRSDERDILEFATPNPPNGFKGFFGADTFSRTGFWTVSTSTGVPESASGTLLICGLVGLAGLALKKSLESILNGGRAARLPSFLSPPGNTPFSVMPNSSLPVRYREPTIEREPCRDSSRTF